jgi:hypothetical protein
VSQKSTRAPADAPSRLTISMHPKTGADRGLFCPAPHSPSLQTTMARGPLPAWAAHARADADACVRQAGETSNAVYPQTRRPRPVSSRPAQTVPPRTPACDVRAAHPTRWWWDRTNSRQGCPFAALRRPLRVGWRRSRPGRRRRLASCGRRVRSLSRADRDGDGAWG